MRRTKSTSPSTSPVKPAAPGEMPATIVVEGARHELLRSLARYRERGEGNATRFVPLYAADWSWDSADIHLAAREAILLGDVETRDGSARVFSDTHLRITDRGYTRIRALFPRPIETAAPSDTPSDALAPTLSTTPSTSPEAPTA